MLLATSVLVLTPLQQIEEAAHAEPPIFQVETLLGNPGKARQKLGWEPRITFEELVGEMVREERCHACCRAYWRDAGSSAKGHL